MTLNEGEAITVFIKDTREVLAVLTPENTICRKDIDVIWGKE